MRKFMKFVKFIGFIKFLEVIYLRCRATFFCFVPCVLYFVLINIFEYLLENEYNNRAEIRRWVAQLVEHRSPKPTAAGSIPVPPAIPELSRLSGGLFYAVGKPSFEC